MTYRYFPLCVLTAITVSTNAFAVQYMKPEEAQRAMFPEATAFKDSGVRLSAEQMAEVQN